MKKVEISSLSTEPLAEKKVKADFEFDNDSQGHRISCHRCGNIRKQIIHCSQKSCPHIFCKNCSVKMKDEYGPETFVNGCPVCKEKCCCSDKSISCQRVNHCYRKCPASKNRAACSVYKAELARTCVTDVRPPLYTSRPEGVLDMLAAVADSQLHEQIATANGKRKFEISADSNSSSPTVLQKPLHLPSESVPSDPILGLEQPPVPSSASVSSDVAEPSSVIGPSPTVQYTTPLTYPNAFAAMMPMFPTTAAAAASMAAATTAASGTGLSGAFHGGFVPFGYLYAPFMNPMMSNGGSAASAATSGSGDSVTGVASTASADSSATAGGLSPQMAPPALVPFLPCGYPAAPFYFDASFARFPYFSGMHSGLPTGQVFGGASSNSLVSATVGPAAASADASAAAAESTESCVQSVSSTLE